MPIQVDPNRPETVTSYEFNGKQYNTQEEAESARKDYIMSTYADAASVGFDQDRFNRLIGSGYGISQMSDDEKKYISNKFLTSADASTKYTNSATDQYLASIGLPPMSDLSKYRTGYAKYMSGGGIAENYGNVTEDQWKKINELWAKDWEYGLTDEDARRKAQGLAPTSYDDMYEDTLLDAQLKANGLPPSKLLNGKLGETYNQWRKDATDFAGFNDAVTRNYITNATHPTLDRPFYTMQNAIDDTLADPKWREFATKHYGYTMTLPNHADESYLKLDDEGNEVFDEEKFQKDWAKAQKNNAALADDEFALTREGLQAYYDANAAHTIADMKAEKYFADNDLRYNKDTRFANRRYVDVMSDYYYGATYNEGEGYTLDLLFPNAEFTDEERGALQPLVDTANQIRTTKGFSASQDYLHKGEFASALNTINNQKIVESYRKKYGDEGLGYNDPESKNYHSDEQILDKYYNELGNDYMMSADEITRLRSGELTISEYMTTKCKSQADAEAFSHAQTENYLKAKGLPSDRDELQKLYDKRAETDAYINSISNDDSDRRLFYMSDKEFEALRSQYANYSTMDGNFAYNMQEHNRLEEVAKARARIRETDPDFFVSGVSSDEIMQILDGTNPIDVKYYANAVAYTPEFAEATKDMDYVNKRFDEIVMQYNTTGENQTALNLAGKYATDDEKRKVVYLADTEGTETKERNVLTNSLASGGGLHFERRSYEVLAGRADIYLNDVKMREWDSMERLAKAERNKYLGQDSDSWIGRTAGGGLTWIGAIVSAIPESFVNLLTDTAKMAQGYDLLSSSRLTWSSDVTANIAQDVGEGFLGEVGSFAVQSIPSMVHSGVSMWLAAHTGGATEMLTLALMGTQAYSGAVDSALRQGANSKQAYVYGLLNGANEMIFEKISIDKFVGDLDVAAAAVEAAKMTGKFTRKELRGVFAKNILKHMASQGFVEGMEEVNTSLANLLAESLVLGYNTSYNQSLEHYKGIVDDENEAARLARADVAKSVFMDFVGGLVSGAIMGLGGDLISTRGGRTIIDRTGLTEFINLTHNLSTISAQDAMAYAQENLELDADGKYTIQSTSAVFNALAEKGADAATLSRVRSELLNENNTAQGSQTIVDRIIEQQKLADKSKLLDAARHYVYRKVDDQGRKISKSSIAKADVDTVVKLYLNELSNKVQTIDIEQVAQARESWEQGIFDAVSELAGFGNVRSGQQMLISYYDGQSKEARDQIYQRAMEYKNTYNKVMKGDAAGNYALMAATIEHAVSNGNALTGLGTIFGENATVAPMAVQNACLNSNSGAAVAFINSVCRGVSVLQQQDGTHLFAGARGSVDPIAYVSSQMALARSMPSESISRAMYDHIVKHGATSETLDLLTAANIYDTMGENQRSLRKMISTFHTTAEMTSLSEAYAKAWQAYEGQRLVMEAHQESDAQELADAEARVAGYEAKIAAIADPQQGVDSELAKTASDLVEAKVAAAGDLDKLRKAQAKRMALTQKELDSAERTLQRAKLAYDQALRDQAAKYIERFGDTLESIRNKDSIQSSELQKRIAQVLYGTAENLNAIEERMIAAERRAAVALGAALGVEVECVDFTDDFFDNKKVANRDKMARGARIGGKVYLNTAVMTADVGSLTDIVLLHEIGHTIEVDVDTDKYRTKYRKFALDYMRSAAASDEAFEWALNEYGEDEMIAEFTRKVALSDPRAVAALCKSAPNMSMRVFQWLTSTRSRMNAETSAQMKLVTNAQRAFAKALRVVQQESALKKADEAYYAKAETQSKADTTAKRATQALNDRAEIATQNTEQKAETPKAEAPAEQRTEATEQTRESTAPRLTDTPSNTSWIRSSEQTAEETPAETTTETEETLAEEPAETVAEDTVEETPSETESPAAGETVEEAPSEEPTAEEQTTEEPQEDFADVVVDEPTEEPQDNFEDIDGETDSDIWAEYQRRAPVGKSVPIVGETLAEGEYLYDDAGNAYDENGNLVQQTQTQPVEEASAQAEAESPAEQPMQQQVTLPFELTAETRLKLLRIVAQMRTQAADSEGRVPKKTNETIVKVVKNQVKNDANYVETPENVLNAYAERYKSPERSDVAQAARHDWTTNYRSTENRNAGIGADAANSTAIEYYTEYDGPTQTIDPFELESRINSVRQQISKVEDNLDWEYEDNEFSRKRLSKLNNELRRLIEEERRTSVKTSLGDVLANLDRYRKNDLISIAEQLSDGAMDETDEMSTSELKGAIREMIEGRELSELEMQMRGIGVWVRPAMDEQTVAVFNTISDQTDEQRLASGDPKVIQTSNGYVVSRRFSKEAFATGNPMFNGKNRNIAMIASTSEFRNGDVGRTVPLAQCRAVVIPNSAEYAEMRADARDAGAFVYNYDESDPTQFDRAIDRAANAKNVQYMGNTTFDDWMREYGEMHPHAEPRVANRPVPRQTADNNKVHRMTGNAASAPVTTDEGYSRIRDVYLPNDTGTYVPVSNERTLNRARSVIERAGSASQAAQDLHRDVGNSNGKATDLLARAELLYAESQNPNTSLTDEERENLFADLCIISSDAGRALQLASRLKYLTPEGHIEYIKQVGKRIADKYEKRTKKRIKLEPTAEEIDEYKHAVTEDQRKEIDKRIGQRFADETSDLTLLDRIRNWRYFAMLGNPRTHFRNMIGNALMRPVSRIKDTINAGYQSIAQNIGNEDLRLTDADRTTAAWTKRVDPAVKDWVEARLKEALPRMQGVSSKYLEAIAEAPKVEDEDLEGSWFKRTWSALTQPVKSAAITQGKTAAGRALNWLSSFNANALELEDASALGKRFRSAMYQIIQARGLDVKNMTEAQKTEIMDYAMQESLRATFRDASPLADALNRLANTNRATRFAMEAVMPFKKTPINIAKRSVEYSPIGLINGAYKLFSNSRSFTQEIARINADKSLTDQERAAEKRAAIEKHKQAKIEAIDRLAAGTTGSLLTALGVLASAMGWVSIGRKDDDLSSFEQSLGKNAYSLNIGDLSVDLSAFAPAAVPLLMGTALNQAFNPERDDAFVENVISVLCETVDPITEMSMLSGIADALSGSSYDDNEDGKNTRWFGQIAANAASSYVSQFVPTLLGQAARIADPYARSYVAGDDYWATNIFGDEVGSTAKSIQNKIPGLAWLSEPKINIHGEEQRNFTNFGEFWLNFANNTIFPATIKMDQKNEIDEELARLYGVVDSANILPSKPSRNLGNYTNKKTGKSEPIKITSDAEYMQYQKEYGQTVYDMLEDLMSSAKYRHMTDEQKADAIEDIIEQAKKATRNRWKAQKIADMK